MCSVSVLAVNNQICTQCTHIYRDRLDAPDDEKKICPDCQRLINLGLEEEK